jgi:hypothetical protein
MKVAKDPPAMDNAARFTVVMDVDLFAIDKAT